MTKVIIVQPYVPLYRVPFFSKLVSKLADSGVSCEIHAQRPSGSQALRGDAAQLNKWQVEKPTRSMRVGRISVQKSLTWREIKASDAVIVGLLGSSPDTYYSLASRLVYNHKVGLWGHIDSYVAPFNRFDQRLERWQLNAGDHVFAYTPGGRRYAMSTGVPETKITTVMNTVDTSSLMTDLKSLSEEDTKNFQSKHGLQKEKTFCFIGGLDQSKRIEFLQRALERLWAVDPEIKLIVGGTGDQEHLLQPSIARGQTISLGRVDSRKKALMGASSRAIAMPGRIGLVAVEALALNLQVLSVRGSFHAPECEYLTEGTSLLYSDDNPDSYANLVADVANTREENHAPWLFPSIDGMVSNFHSGVLRLVGG